jgi:uncharacterized membrane protein YfcA
MGLQLILRMLLSAGIGLSLGWIGGGGSIITVPVLVYVFGLEVHQAIGTSLAVVGATSLIGAMLHARHGAVDFKSGLLFGGTGMVGALLGSRLTHLFSPSGLLLSFAALMLVVGAAMLVRKPKAAGNIGSPRRSLPKAAMAGIIVGALTGFLGVGGGFLILPALVLFSGLEMKEAIGTSLLVIAINSSAGLVGHLSNGEFDLRLTLLVTGLAVTGALAGTALSRRTSSAHLDKVFAGLVILVGLLLTAKNFDALL